MISGAIDNVILMEYALNSILGSMIMTGLEKEEKVKKVEINLENVQDTSDSPIVKI